MDPQSRGRLGAYVTLWLGLAALCAMLCLTDVGLRQWGRDRVQRELTRLARRNSCPAWWPGVGVGDRRTANSAGHLAVARAVGRAVQLVVCLVSAVAASDVRRGLFLPADRLRDAGSGEPAGGAVPLDDGDRIRRWTTAGGGPCSAGMAQQTDRAIPQGSKGSMAGKRWREKKSTPLAGGRFAYEGLDRTIEKRDWGF